MRLDIRIDVTEAAAVMQRHGIHRVLVTEDGVLVGIVSAMDIAAAVARHQLEIRRFVFSRGARPHRRWP